MPDLITTLEHEHKSIMTLLEKARGLGPNSPEGRKILGEATRLLMQHMKRDDEEVFPVLERAADSNGAVKEALRWFVVHRTISAEAVSAVCERLQSPASEFEYAKDFGSLMAIVTNRLQREESILYPVFRQVAGGSKG